MRGKRAKDQDVAASEQGLTTENGVVVSRDTGKVKRRIKLPQLSRKQWIVVAVLALLVAAGGGLVIWQRLHNKPVDLTQYNLDKDELIRLSDDANFKAGQNKAAEAIPALETYVNKPELAKDLKLAAQKELASTYLNAAKYDQAITTYQQVSTAQGGESSATAAGQAAAYRAKGDKQNAIAFYQKAIELGEQELTKLKEGDGAILTYKQQIVAYKMIIKGLQGTP